MFMKIIGGLFGYVLGCGLYLFFSEYICKPHSGTRSDYWFDFLLCMCSGWFMVPLFLIFNED